MEKTIERLAGDTPGTEFSLTVLTFRGSDSKAPSVYMQAALHGNELPGTAALHLLIPRLEAAEAEGRLRGDVTLVPFANPIGLGQYVFEDQQGRFAFGSRVNFNRGFQHLGRPDPALVSGDGPGSTVERRMKAALLRHSMGKTIVLDLHCDSESLAYLYVPAPLWPHMADAAEALGCAAVLTFEGGTDGSFDEASIHPYLSAPPEVARFPERVVATVELRGTADVSPEIAARDADGLYRFLVGRGVVVDGTTSLPARTFSGVAVPQTYVEMVRAPKGGLLLFHVLPGERVEPGTLLAEIVGEPGEAASVAEVRAETAGLVLTRISPRSVRVGDDLIKIVGGARWSRARDNGALES
jgi:predicted deacylase